MSQPYDHRAEIERLDQRPGSTSGSGRARGGRTWHLYISWNEPAVAPPAERLPPTEIFRRLARRLGLDVPCLYDSDEELARQLLDSDHPSLRGITFDALRKRGWMRLAVPEPFVPFADGFPAPSGKLEFYTARMTEAGLHTTSASIR